MADDAGPACSKHAGASPATHSPYSRRMVKRSATLRQLLQQHKNAQERRETQADLGWRFKILGSLGVKFRLVSWRLGSRPGWRIGRRAPALVDDISTAASAPIARPPHNNPPAAALGTLPLLHGFASHSFGPVPSAPYHASKSLGLWTHTTAYEDPRSKEQCLS